MLVLWEERLQLRNKKKAHVVQSEEDEPALFMVCLHQSYVPTPEEELLKSLEVIDDGITARLMTGQSSARTVGREVTAQEQGEGPCGSIRGG